MIAARNRYFLVVDAALLLLVTLAAYLIRFEGWDWPAGTAEIAVTYLAVVLPLKLAAMWMAGLYRRLWRYASVGDLERIVVAGAASAVCCLIIGGFLLPAARLVPQRVPLSVLFIDGLLTAIVVAFPRLLVRVTARWKQGRLLREGRRVLVVGAGAAGGLIVRELIDNPQLGMTPVGFVDDDPGKHHHKIHNVRVLGPLSSLEVIVQQFVIGEVVIAMPTAPGSIVREVLRAAHRAGVPTRTVPGIFEIISGRKSVSALRQVDISDLLRREPIETDLEQVRKLASRRTVLVTGAGGSIGSELCRQLARFEPSLIVALGRGENSIFELIEELTRTFPEIPVAPVIADVRDRGQLECVFRRYRPFSVFHAAAHKHVPLMEHNVAEAVLNNVLGTRNVVRLAAEHGTQHFVLISTDKAVRPTSIMGATKRLAEGIVHEAAEQTRKPYISVRFGNVLGSRGSVVPTFMRQIAAGGPVTVTHPEMRRYFMTIPEAVQLVLQAGAMGRGQETFVLDMGEPVKIADLASDLIRLSGLEVNTDIEIRFTGSRPGEKLYEELFFSAENAVATSHPKILRGLNTSFYRDCPVSVAELIEAAAAHTSDDRLREMISLLVPEYEPPMTGDAPRRRAVASEVAGFGRAAAIGRGVVGSDYPARAGRRPDAAPRRSQS